METLLRNNFLFYLCAALFLAFCFWRLILALFKATKNVTYKQKKVFLRIFVIGILVCVWIFDFIVFLFPISLAFYEYKNNSIEEIVGVVDCIEQERNDRVVVVIEGMNYIAIHNTKQPFVPIGSNIDEGDTVKIRYGENSKFIFEISEIST